VKSLLPFVITGIATGSLYGLAGLGLVLTYRTSGVFNFGHGAIAAGAAFVFYTLHVTHGWPWPLAALVTLGFFATVVGWVLERITRGLGDVPGAVVVVATVGILLATEGLLFLRYGDVTRNFPQFLPASGFTVSGVNVSWAQLISVVLAAGSAAVLYVFLRSSRLGVAMRAVVDNPTLVSLAGERPGRVRGASWAIGAAFAALSGILLAPTLGLDANLLTLLVVQAFGACAIGLFSSLPLTYAGGIIVGVAASLATKYFTRQPFTGLPSTVPYLFLIVVLLVVPVAKLPQRRASLRSLIAEAQPLSRRTVALLTLIGGAGLLVVPAVVGPKLPVWTSALSYVVIFGSLALLVWTSGQISLCHMTFAAVGATTMSHMTHNHLPWLAALALAGLFTVPVGALVAIPAIRLSGIYLALITLGFGILMQNVVFGTSLMFGSKLVATAPRPHLAFIDGTNDKWLYYVVLLFAALTCAVLAAIYRGRLGRLLRAMAESPTMLSTHGLGVNMTRLIVFCVSAFFAGIGGALAITQTGSASGVGFGPISSLLLLAVLAICGTRLLRSSILAAAAIALLPGYVTRFGADQQTFTFGVVAIGAALLIARRSQLTSWLSQSANSSSDRLARGPVTDRWTAIKPPAREPVRVEP
jgi:branched-subunit amino acid ABC-type transport system permease component